MLFEDDENDVQGGFEYARKQDQKYEIELRERDSRTKREARDAGKTR